MKCRAQPCIGDTRSLLTLSGQTKVAYKEKKSVMNIRAQYRT